VVRASLFLGIFTEDPTHSKSWKKTHLYQPIWRWFAGFFSHPIKRERDEDDDNDEDNEDDEYASVENVPGIAFHGMNHGKSLSELYPNINGVPPELETTPRNPPTPNNPYAGRTVEQPAAVSAPIVNATAIAEQDRVEALVLFYFSDVLLSVQFDNVQFGEGNPSGR